MDALSDDPDEMQRQLQDMAGPGAVIRIDTAIGRELHDAWGAADDAGAGEAAGGDAMGFDRGQPLAETAAAAVGDEGDGVAARQQLAGERLGREHVATGAAGGERDARAHVASPRPARRRVSASTMPMASESASSDEPP